MFLVGGTGTAFSRNALLNEFSQGTNALNREWVEILFLKDSNAAGWTLADANTGVITFNPTALWSNVAAGTLLVVYNAADRDTKLPADDLDPANGILIVPHTNATLFSATAWIGLANSSAGDSIALRDASATLIDGLSYGNNSTFAPQLAAVGGGSSASYTNNTESGVDVAANWQIVSWNVATPGTGNGTVNSNFIANILSGAFNTAPLFRFGASGDTVPGLTIDPMTGLISGTLNVPGGGFFNVVIERFSGTNLVSQQYNLLVGDASNLYTIPTGKTWTLNTNYTIAGSLTVQGLLDTAGWTLVVSNTLDVSGGMVSNAASGVIYYGTLVGGPLPGTSYQLAATDSDGDGLPDAWELTYFPDLSHNGNEDADGDGFTNLQEYQAGTNPALSSSAPAITQLTRSSDNYLITFATVSGKSYEVQRCTNLVAGIWTPVTNLVANAASSQATDPGGATLPEVFYRVRIIP